MIGASLNQYQIIASLGAGGMGEVFRARDTRLNREVAVKVLPKDFATDSDRLRRFEQEAKTLAALNHPNVLTVFDAGVHEGAPYLVCELLEGRTLREEMNGGALPVRKATDYALQIAQGMAAAHGQGIIHRDLKPENIFVTKDGRVKILDFGLAKLGEKQKAESRKQTSPVDAEARTLAGSTEPGRIMGTPNCMSPEQVRGEPADHRSDIFAFGCVLYEVLSGTRAFRRDTPVQSLHAVLTEDPPNLGATRPDVPPALERVVFRCLEKQAENRFQSAKDLAFAIENAGTSSSAFSRIAAGHAAPPGFRLGALLPWVVAAICLAGAFGSILTHKNSAGAPAVPGQAGVLRKFDLTLPTPARGSRAPEVYLSISPDGKKFAYVNADGLWVRRLDSIEPPLLLAPGEYIPALFWSPQSTEVGYFQGRHLYRIASTGGTPRLIGTAPEAAPNNLAGGAWLGDRIIFTTGDSGLLEIPALGGSVATVLPKAPSELDFHHASALPGGRGVLFVIHRPSGPDTIAVWSPGGQRKVLLHIPGGSLRTPVFSPTGHVLFGRWDHGRGLWAFPFSLDRLERTDRAFRVWDAGSAPSVANDGTLVFSLRDSVLYEPRQLAWVDRSGKVLGTIGSPMAGLGQPSLSPEGQRVVAIAGESTTEYDLWLFDVAGSGPTPLTRNDQPDTRPCWWNGGRTIVFVRRTESGSQVMTRAADGSGVEQTLMQGAGARLSRSGKYLILSQRAATGKATLGYVRMMEEPRKLVAFPEAFQSISGYELSPDDYRLAYETEEADTVQVYVVDFPGFTNRWKVSRAGGQNMRWHPDGTELFYMSGDRRALMSAKLKPDGLGMHEPAKVFDLPESISAWPFDYDVAADGQRFLMLQKVQTRPAATAARPNVRVVLNWFEEFREKK